MSEINKTRHSQGWLVWFIPLLLADFALVIAFLIYGKNIALLHPKGLIAEQQLSLLIFATVLLLVIAVPVIGLLYFIAWKYRETNTKAVHDPTAKHSKFVILGMWIVPAIFMAALAAVMWPATHKLEPKKSIAADAKPLTIQVVSMRWKWVFIYPEQKIATVNFVQLPVNTPVTFELTGDEAPMSSFWIPNLGGQLYSMTSHVNRLNLIADTPGDYRGSTAELNGAGFAGMKFIARASSAEDFARWVDEVKQSKDVLSNTTYDALLNPSENNPVVLYSDYEGDIYGRVVKKYFGQTAAHGSHGATDNTHGGGH